MNKTYFNIVKNLIITDCITLKNIFWDKYINLVIWMILSIFVMGYILQSFGLSDEFGLFQCAGVIGSIGLFVTFDHCLALIIDLNNDQILKYRLTLPIPSYMIFISKIIYYFLYNMLFSLTLLPIGKICLWHKLNLMDIFYGKLLLAIIIQNMFYSTYALLMSSLVKHISKLGSLWSRYIFPMWILGGLQFSWYSLYQSIGSLSYLFLFNPIIYITESTRAAMLGQEGYINYWLCMPIILFFTIFFCILGIHNLKKKLEYV